MGAVVVEEESVVEESVLGSSNVVEGLTERVLSVVEEEESAPTNIALGS